jgi:hypothetical protein
VGRVTERRWDINRTMTLQDGLALQVRKQIYPAIVYQGTCEFKYTMSARFAAHKTTCQDFVHGARQVSVCVHLFRAGIEWWAEGGMATNSGAVTMRLSALRLIADGSVRSELGQDIVQAGGHIQASTARVDLRALPAGRPVSGVIGFRMTWGDGTCYPLCSPPNSDFLSVGSTTT